jgi:Do/DeqQ family serine protease
MSKGFSWISVLVISLVSSLGALYPDRKVFRSTDQAYQSISERQTDILGKYFSDTLPAFGANINFVAPAQRVKSSVVHIRSSYDKSPENIRRFHEDVPGFDDFFSLPGPGKESSGSGVILTDQGYIVTNHHVIDQTSKVEVVLDNKQSYKAEIVGSDPTTDLALLKINATGLPFVKYGNSDALEIGEWVLAIGNPFDLTSTVTAGIISGKGRSINLLREKSNLAIESFIQTDAAVNPGNSGGALINLKGELVGINTAIASPTGSYSGYSFAVPANLVKKVVDDLQKFGVVQRGLLGISITDIDARLAEEYSLSSNEGVYVREVGEGSAAGDAGIRKGDIITALNGKKTGSVPELQEMVGRFRPGEKVNITLKRGGEEKTVSVTLKNQNGNTRITRKESGQNLELEELEAIVAPVSEEKKRTLGISYGVEIMELTGSRLEKAGISAGFVIQKLDKQAVKTPEQLRQWYRRGSDAILIEGTDTEGRKRFFALVK